MIHELIAKICIALAAAWMEWKGADDLLRSRFYVYRTDFEEPPEGLTVGQAIEVTIKIVDDPNLEAAHEWLQTQSVH